MINEGEEVFVLPFTALDYEYLFWKYRLARFKSEVIYSVKDSIGLLAHGKKKDGKPKIAGEKMFRQKCLGYVCFKLFPVLSKTTETYLFRCLHLSQILIRGARG